MKFYRVNANKAGDNGWVQCVENDIIWVPVTSKYLKRKEKERCHPFATKGTDRLKCGPGMHGNLQCGSSESYWAMWC